MKDKYTGKVAATVIKHPLEDKYLVAKRTDGHGWEFPGGKQEKGETLKQTAEREIEEELKLNVNAKEVAEKSSYTSAQFEIVPIFAKPESNNIEKTIELTEHSEIRWIDPKNLENLDIDLGAEKQCLEAFKIT